MAQGWATNTYPKQFEPQPQTFFDVVLFVIQLRQPFSSLWCRTTNLWCYNKPQINVWKINTQDVDGSCQISLCDVKITVAITSKQVLNKWLYGSQWYHSTGLVQTTLSQVNDLLVVIFFKIQNIIIWKASWNLRSLQSIIFRDKCLPSFLHQYSSFSSSGMQRTEKLSCYKIGFPSHKTSENS